MEFLPSVITNKLPTSALITSFLLFYHSLYKAIFQPRSRTIIAVSGERPLLLIFLGKKKRSFSAFTVEGKLHNPFLTPKNFCTVPNLCGNESVNDKANLSAETCSFWVSAIKTVLLVKVLVLAKDKNNIRAAKNC